MNIKYITSSDFILPKDSDKYFGLDTETTGLDIHVSHIRLVQISTLTTQYVYDIFKLSEEDKLQLKFFIERNKFYIHNALFDVPFLIQDLHIKSTSVVDTMVLYSCILKRTYTNTRSSIDYPKTLKSVMKVLFNKDISKLQQTSDWSVTSLSTEQIEYAGLDALFVLMIGNKLANHPITHTLNFKLTNESILPLSYMKFVGLKLDVSSLDNLIKEWNEKISVAFDSATKIFTDVNINSSKQLSDWIEAHIDTSTWERTEKTGKLITDSKELSKHLKELPELECLLTYKKYNKYLSTYGENIKAFINPITERIHGSYTLGYTDTGRLSSMKPNIQNFPREEWYRKLFIPEKGHVFVCADFSQVEVRVAAILSGEDKMISAYKNGKDLYKHTASLLLHKPESEITKAERQQAKAVVLGLQFGMGAKTLKEYALNYGVEFTKQESMMMVERYRESYPKLYEWQLNITALAKETKETRTVGGMVRRLSEDNYYTCSLNTPVQGSAAEVILTALCALQRLFIRENKRAWIVACVHDEILIECEESIKTEIKQILEQIMHKAFTFIFKDKGINGADANIVEAHIGTSWYEAK